MIWTEDENEDRIFENMLDPMGKNCASCHWGGDMPDNPWVTCGHHHDNFLRTSLCSYWTNPADPKLIEYIRKKQKEFNEKRKSNENISD